MNREEEIARFRNEKLPEYIADIEERQEFEKMLKDLPILVNGNSVKSYKCEVCGKVKSEHFFGQDKTICKKCKGQVKTFTCVKCGKKKPITEFYGNYKKLCKECKNNYQMQNYYKRRIKNLEAKIIECQEKLNEYSRM